MPRLARFTGQHPNLRVAFTLDDARQDLIGESVDVAVRIGALEDSTAVAWRIGTVHRVLVAAPAYLARAGTPLTPSDLNYSSAAWLFRKDGKSTSVRAEGRIVIDLAEAATAAAVAGLGVLSLDKEASKPKWRRAPSFDY